MAANSAPLPHAETFERRGGRPLVPNLTLAPTTTTVPAPSQAAIEEKRALSEVEARERTFRRLLAESDVIAALLALIVSVWLLGDDRLTLMTLAALPIIVFASKVQGLYDRDELVLRKSTTDEIPQIFQLATLYTLLIWLFDDQLITGTLGSAQVAVLWAMLFTFAVGGRFVARQMAIRATPRERCLFIGEASAYARLCHKIEGQSRTVEMVGRMSLQRIARTGARNASTQELKELVGWANAHRVIIDPQTLPQAEMHDLVRAAKNVGVRVSLLPSVLDVVGTSVVLDEIEGMTIMGVRRFGLTRSSRFVKRLFDLSGAIVGLLVVAPVLAALALAIKLDTRGPVLFRQQRVGRDGEKFRICKFRTMVVDAEERKAELMEQNECAGGAMFKMADDPRITRVGRLLRKTSLDELPQLFNVLWGNMSLVGPRPLIVDEDEQITGFDRRRLSLTPGMTGHWQILGSARVPMHEMVKIDYLYVGSWSLWNDVKLLIRTVPYMLRRGGM